MTSGAATKIRVLAWLLLAMLFSAYLLNADRVYHALSGKSYVWKLPDSFSLRAQGDLSTTWNGEDFDLPVNNEFEEGKGLWGKFMSFADKKGDAQLRVFLRSPHALYEVIGNGHSFWANEKKTSFGFFASTSGLENGVYTIGLYLRDDEGERFTWKDNFFEKIDGGPADYIARSIALPRASAKQEQLNFAFDKIEQKNERLAFSGWVVLDGAHMDDYNAYLSIKDPKGSIKNFYAPLFTRMDIASFYKSTRAASCGFQISIPRAELSSGKHGIRVVLQSRTTGEIIAPERTDTVRF
jgi:hypothetical protein